MKNIIKLLFGFILLLTTPHSNAETLLNTSFRIDKINSIDILGHYLVSVNVSNSVDSEYPFYILEFSTLSPSGKDCFQLFQQGMVSNRVFSTGSFGSASLDVSSERGVKRIKIKNRNAQIGCSLSN